MSAEIAPGSYRLDAGKIQEEYYIMDSRAGEIRPLFGGPVDRPLFDESNRRVSTFISGLYRCSALALCLIPSEQP